MFHDFFAGFFYVPRGLALTLRPGLRRYVIVPATINVVLFASAFVLIFGQFDHWLHGFLPQNLSWLSWLILPFFFIALSLGVFYLFGLIANLISSPFNALLAESLELQLGGHPPSAGAGLKQSMHSALIGLRTQLSALLYQLVRLIPLLILSWIPVINLVATSILIVFSAWMLAVGYIATPMGNHNITFREVRDICNRYKFLILGLGTGLLLLTWIPGLNFFALPAGTAAATALWTERLATFRQS